VKNTKETIFLIAALENFGLVQQVRNNSTAVNELHGLKRPELGCKLLFHYARQTAKWKKNFVKQLHE